MTGNPRKYRFIEHTADTGLVAYGNTLAEAYVNAAVGMFSIITDLRKVREIEARRVEVREQDAEALLFEWLNSLLYYLDTEMLLFKRFDIVSFDDLGLTAMCWGERYDSARHNLNTGVKAATYHMLAVDKESNQVRVIFDV